MTARTPNGWQTGVAEVGGYCQKARVKPALVRLLERPTGPEDGRVVVLAFDTGEPGSAAVVLASVYGDDGQIRAGRALRVEGAFTPAAGAMLATEALRGFCLSLLRVEAADVAALMDAEGRS